MLESTELSCNARPTKLVELGNGVKCGGKSLTVISGPCAVEDLEQMKTVTESLTSIGVSHIRGCIYKPRTSPYSYQGAGLSGIEILRAIKEEFGVSIVTEVMSGEHLESVCGVSDVLQVGSRNMQNFELLKSLGQVDKPVILKRGLSATLDEMVMAAEYILAGGNQRVILCERGIRSFDPSTRNVLDLGAVVALKYMTDLPVIVDPSHAAGRSELVADLARAAVAVGADGLLIECHPRPRESVSDARQALSLEEMETLMNSLRLVAASVGRTLDSDCSEGLTLAASNLVISKERKMLAS